ncbi:MAG: peptide chain release factor N(5)-glutamine methyltransferase [Rickettsiales bacterium]|jgi:release factor glutamine methyltransferase|nr:peptide chain release factor N(5)-glutamine methyltransferase [Rickettsiales bacterium]
MNPNQAFDILRDAAGNAHDAKIVLNAIGDDDVLVAVAADKLRRGVPVAKIIGRKWFYGLEFETNGDTLDPRPDSEILVEAVLNSPPGGGVIAPQILDLGTGTGNLICAIVKNLPGATGVGVDISRGAVRVARRNVERLGLADRIKIVHGDFNVIARSETTWQSIHNSQQTRTSYGLPRYARNDSVGLFDIIISNPPYIAIGDRRVNDAARHDPAGALYAGADGLDAYRALANVRCAPHFFIEIGAGQFSSVRKIFTDNGWQFVRYYKDLGGKIRVVEFKLQSYRVT